MEKNFFANKDMLARALASVTRATFATCDEDDKDMVTHEEVMTGDFPRIIICVRQDTKHYLGDNQMTPPQLVLWPSSWKKEGIRIVAVGTILGVKDTLCGPCERGVLFETRLVRVYKEKILLASISY